MAQNISLAGIAPLVRAVVFTGMALGLTDSASRAMAQETPDNAAPAIAQPKQAVSAKPVIPAAATQGKKGKEVYAGPATIVVLPATPMLDSEGKQRMDPSGNPLFNPAVNQLRDKKGHPVFDVANNPVFQTATSLGYDEKGKKISAKKIMAAKAVPISISSGTLTIDGWTGKARLNYEIADLKYVYIYAPGIGTTIVSPNSFPGAIEQPGAFDDKTLKITVEGHPMEVSSDKRLLGKKPQAAWVAVDRGFQLPSKFPVFGYGTTTKPPYTWPGSKDSVALKGPMAPPPLPTDLRPTLLLAPCPAGMMRPSVVQGQKSTQQPCVPINSPTAGSSTPTPPAAQPSK